MSTRTVKIYKRGCKYNVMDLDVTASDVGAMAAVSASDVCGFTEGSIPFANTAGCLTEDNSNLNYDNVNNRVGIGFPTPQAKLHIQAGGGTGPSISSETALLVIDTSSTTSNVNASIVSGQDGEARLHFGKINDEDVATIKFNNTSAKMTFANSTIDAVTIDSSGNVGVGTTSPGADLHIDHSNSTTFWMTVDNNSATRYEIRMDVSSSGTQIRHDVFVSGSGNVVFDVNPQTTSGVAQVRFHRETNNTGGSNLVRGFAGDGAGTTSWTLSGNSNSKNVLNEQGVGIDTQIKGENIDNLFFLDASTDRIGIGTATPSHLLEAQNTSSQDLLHIGASETVINEAGQGAYDFRVEGDSRANLLFVDGGNARVGIGQGDFPSELLHVREDTGSVASNPNGTSFFINSTSNVADNSGMAIQAGTAGNAFIALGDNGDADVCLIDYDNNVNKFTLKTNAVERMSIDSAGNVVFNDTSADSDFRVEGATLPNLFIVNAGQDRIGINTTGPSFMIEILSKDANMFGIQDQNGDASLTFTGDAVAGADLLFKVGDVTGVNAGALLTQDMANEVTHITNSKFGVGTTTIPHAAVGAAMFALDGANGNLAGPHVQFTTALDNHPLLQILNWTHDNISFQFDAYYNGAWRSSDATSNFQLYKTGDKLKVMRNAAATAAGSVVSWEEIWAANSTGFIVNDSGLADVDFRVETDSNTHGFFVDASSNNIGINNSAPGAGLHISDSGECLRIADTVTTGSPFISFYQTTTRRAFIQYLDSGDVLRFASEYGDMHFYTGTSGSEVLRMTIDQSGNVDVVTRFTSDTRMQIPDGGESQVSSNGDISVDNATGGASLFFIDAGVTYYINNTDSIP